MRPSLSAPPEAPVPGISRRTGLFLAVLVAALLVAAAAAVDAIAQTAAPEQAVLVRFERDATASERAAARREARASFEESLPLRGLQVVDPDPGVSPADVAERLRRSGEVMYAEPDAPRQAFAFPDDEFASLLWGMRNTGQSIQNTTGVPDADIDADEAWDVTTGDAAVSVGIMDTGVTLTHPDLAANIRESPGESGALATNGVDDDANGLVDDWRGWDWVNDDNDPTDENWHGTHVAGTVGARGGDATGVMGVAWRAGITPLRVLDANGNGQVSDLIAAYGYARTQGLKIVNASLGGGSYSLAERDAIAAASDTLFVVAAGNGGPDEIGDNNELVPTYPCGYNLPNVICVGATGQNDALAGFSNFGATSVDLAAPGVNIGSSAPGPDWWVYASGTSMATPHVAGAAVLVWTQSPSATVADVRAALLGSVDPKPGLAAKTVTGGRLNAFRALGGVPVPPPVTPPPVGGGGSSTPSQPVPTPVPETPAPRPRPLTIAVALRGRLVLRLGVRVSTRCSRACRVSHELVLGAPRRVIGRARVRLGRAGVVTVRLKLGANARRRLRRANGLRVQLRTRAVDSLGGERTAKRTVRLFRR